MIHHGTATTVAIRPYRYRVDGDEVVLATDDGDALIALPLEGLELIESLAAGRTVDDTVRAFEQRHGETPDIDDFLEVLAAEGLLLRDPGRPATGHHGHVHQVRGSRSIDLDWISPRVARALTGPVAVTTALALNAGGVALVVIDPSVLPGPMAFTYPGGDFGALTLLTVAFGLLGTLVHEFAHAAVARGAEVPVRLGISTLMYTVVAQTDISGIQLAPKRTRYLAYVSGGLADLATAALMLGVLYGGSHGVIALPHDVELLLKAVVFTYLLRVVFQFDVYLRTDVYYVVATAFDCRDLMGDTERLLRNVFFRILRRRHLVTDQSDISPRERRVVRGYAVVYVAGRVAAIVFLVTILLPVLIHIVGELAAFVMGRPSSMGMFDLIVVLALFLLFDVGGLVMWVRSMARGLLRWTAGLPARG